MPLAHVAQLAALSAGFQLAVRDFTRTCNPPTCSPTTCNAATCNPARWGLRFVVGLAAGGALAHLGWAVLHADRIVAQPQLVLDLRSGYTLLTAPLGVVLLASGLPRAERADYLAACARALPLGLACAKAGCAAAGCCGPSALPEAALLLALHALCARVAPRRAAALFCLGLGALRLAGEPFRPVPSFGPPLVPPALLCAAWLALGLVSISHSAGPGSGEHHAEARPRPRSVGAGKRALGRG